MYDQVINNEPSPLQMDELAKAILDQSRLINNLANSIALLADSLAEDVGSDALEPGYLEEPKHL